MGVFMEGHTLRGGNNPLLVFYDNQREITKEDANVCSIKCQSEGATAVTMFISHPLFVLGRCTARRANLNSFLLLAPSQRQRLRKVEVIVMLRSPANFPYFFSFLKMWK